MKDKVNSINYDNEYDILYVFTTTPKIAYEDEIQPGIFLRLDDNTDEVIGATITGYKTINKNLLDNIIPFSIDHQYINDNFLSR